MRPTPMEGPDMSRLLEIRDLTIGCYLNGQFIPIVDGLDLQINTGEILGIVGESGSGKSMTARAVMGLLGPGLRIQKGQIIYFDQDGSAKDICKLKQNGRDIRKLRGNKLAMIFQEPMASLSPVHTIGDQISTTLRQHTDLSKKSARSRAIDLLHDVGMSSPEEIAEQYPHKISGGMRQRAMIAMALSCEPRLLICDEPTTALDVTTEAQIVELLYDLQQRLDMAILFISHNIALVSEISERIMVMYLGQAIETGDTTDVLKHPRHPYTRALLSSLPSLAEPGARLATIEGQVPEPTMRPTGCQFHPRCPDILNEKCSLVDPYKAKAQQFDGRSSKVWCHLYE